MWLDRTLWLLFCYAQYAKSSLLEEYEEISRSMLYPPEDKITTALPIDIGKDHLSGCICRSSKNRKVIVCFGNYECRRFPKIKRRSETLVVRTTVLPEIRVGDLDSLYYLKSLKIDANHQLKYLQPWLFRNLTILEELSISYNTNLHVILDDTFVGLKRLKKLILVNNGFTNILKITPAFKPSILPALKKLDISENSLEKIPENAFAIMKGSALSKIDINLCRLDYIHPNSFLPLYFLEELNIGENDLNSSIISDFLVSMRNHNRNLTHLDLNSMGFRKHPPRHLMEVIASTKIETLILSNNQFEILTDEAFPNMPNVKMMDLQAVSTLNIDEKTFGPSKFPELRILLLSGNNLPGIHLKHISCSQLVLLDLSSNRGTTTNPVYYEIDSGSFLECKDLKILNLGFNRIKSIFNYTFLGLEKLRMLNLENGTLFRIGEETFKPMKQLEILNLANNPLTANTNLSSGMFKGLNALKVLILKNCGIKYIFDDDNIFEMMPNLTHLILKNNEMFYVTSELLKPLKFLQVLDLSDNLIVSWWKPLFLSSGLQPHNVYLTNNKISHFTLSMIQDINFLLQNRKNMTIEIDLLNNVFICDCSSMYRTYMWLQVNGSEELKEYFKHSSILCNSPDVWEDKRVAYYFSSINTVRCAMNEKISGLMLLVWTAPSLVTVIFLMLFLTFVYKYRIYLRYWLFLAKLALGRTFLGRSLKAIEPDSFKYDAFVSYCSDDNDFVSEMVNQLERCPPYLKLCIYERDFEIGAFISEAILASIKESRYVILVISNNFAKSQWCRWETQLADYHRLSLENGVAYDPLVLIRIGEVENKYLTTTLKFLLKTKIYLSWDHENEDEFWRRLRDVIVKKRRSDD